MELKKMSHYLSEIETRMGAKNYGTALSKIKNT